MGAAESRQSASGQCLFGRHRSQQQFPPLPAFPGRGRHRLDGSRLAEIALPLKHAAVSPAARPDPPEFRRRADRCFRGWPARRPKQTVIGCTRLPCPDWAVEDAAGSALIGVEQVVADPADDGVAIQTRLWQLLAANGYQPIAVEGYIIDRPRLQGSPEFQRVLVVTAGPEGLLQP